MIDEGVMGKSLATLQPILSPMLWTSIATGKHPEKHGIHGFIVSPNPNGGARPYSSHSLAGPGIVELSSCARRGCRIEHVINWWAEPSGRATVIDDCVSDQRVWRQ